jgi:hypothetical protein
MKIMVPYEHNSTNFDIIEMAVSEGRSEREPLEGWVAAYRDTVDGKKVIWARFEHSGTVWVRDSSGSKRVLPLSQG